MFPQLDPVIHQPNRLQIITLLHRNRDAAFTWLRDTLALTDGNLGRHAARLCEAGYVVQKRVLTRTGFQLRLWITPQGDQAFRSYLDGLRAYLEAQTAKQPPGADL